MQAMEEIFDAGKAKAIGVSNYEKQHLLEMDDYAKIPPAVNQIEVHPFWYRKELIEYCHLHDIVVVDYSPLVRAHHMTHPTINEIAEAHKKSPAQILLRWGLELGDVVIPKSHSAKHIKENIDIFDFKLSKKEMQRLAELNQHESVVQ